MREIKDRTDANKPPKKPASAYILFQKDVSSLSKYNQSFEFHFDILETS